MRGHGAQASDFGLAHTEQNPDTNRYINRTMEPRMTFSSAFVTGATGLLGNNLVRILVSRGVRVKALARSAEKARRQLAGLDLEIVEGDMTDVAGFARHLSGCDVLFHTAAHFRDSYKGGNHWEALRRINVDATIALFEAAHAAGIRRVLHTSSIATVTGAEGMLINEEMWRDETQADDYYRSKIQSDRAVYAFMERRPEMDVRFVLPGWMHGPGDAGPTSAGQLVLDIAGRKLPGIVDSAFSVVDARDVALAEIAAIERGRRGERYLAAGRFMTMAEIVPLIGRIVGVPTPTRKLPTPVLFAIALAMEGFARLTGRPVLLSLATARNISSEGRRTRFDHSKTERELGIRFRSVEETIADEVAWFRDTGAIAPAPARMTAAAA
jgi:dihydroflavonol-4-reductase